MTARPNYALHGTAAGRRSCNRRVSWPPSLSLGSLGRPVQSTLDVMSENREHRCEISLIESIQKVVLMV